MNKLRLVFMGTPQFAVTILDTILQSKHEVVAVVTAPDKPAGRGQQLKFSDVKTYALSNNIPILQPTNLKDPNFIEELSALKADCHVVVAFRMLPEAVWKMPPLGTFNLHASLLPNYRGAAPINWAIINGETTTGVTTFFLDDKIDTGHIILNKSLEIGPDETVGELHDRLMQLGATTVIETLDAIASQSIIPKPQEAPEENKSAHKLTKENTKINWHNSASTIHNFIRGLSPYPSAWTVLINKSIEQNVKIYASRKTTISSEGVPGQISIQKDKLLVSTLDGTIEILELQLPGKKRMLSKDLLNGVSFSDDALFC